MPRLQRRQAQWRSPLRLMPERRDSELGLQDRGKNYAISSSLKADEIIKFDTSRGVYGILLSGPGCGVVSNWN